MWLPKVKDVSGFAEKCGCALYWIFVCASLAVAYGCESIPSGMKVTASSATYTNIGDINWDEYKIPVLSLYLGPKATLWVNKDYKALKEVEVSGAVTNTTEALAIYDSREHKTLRMRIKFNDGAAADVTNIVESVAK